jgi:CHAD domain-containing protein/HD superfamily phosphodiesterase
MATPNPHDASQVVSLNSSAASLAPRFTNSDLAIDKLRLMGTPAAVARTGLEHWMHEVLVRCDDAAKDFSSGPVHDLRTALRRCRSLAEGIRVFDADSGWKKMRRAGKELFSSLGALRDTHVIAEWVENMASPGDPTREILLAFLNEQEKQEKKSAAAALDQFDHKQWQSWAEKLPDRGNRMPVDSPVFAHLALERWRDAHDLHKRAMRNRTNCAFHDLRIGIKRFRYTVENFLPGLHARWGDDLKELQDSLGDVHDLDVLWETAARIKAFPDAAARAYWRSRLVEKRNSRLNVYRTKMIGKDSLWIKWRRELPASSDLQHLALKRLEIWASFLDPDFDHARHVADLALQLYDHLSGDSHLKLFGRNDYRSVLHSSALMHDAGHFRTNKGHHKVSARLIRGLEPPMGLNTGELRLMALIARYHRGALPRETQPRFAALSPTRQRLVQCLAGILRLACACDHQHDGRIRHIKLESSTPVCTLRAEGYDEADPLAEHLAAARHLLELACRRPILILPATHGASRAA